MVTMKNTERKDRMCFLIITTKKQRSLLFSGDLEYKKTKDMYSLYLILNNCGEK